jgi:hypothetical protein
MNRGIALFVGLAALFAHTLAIYSDGSGSIPPAYDHAYAAFRLAHDLVHERALRWDPNGPAYESYPSIVWALWIAVGERLRVSPNAWSQWTGMIAALGSVAALARFHAERIASLMGPLMLVASGGLAAAAACGTETALLTLLVTVSFLAFEHGRSRRLALALALLVALRPDGTWIAGALLALYLMGRRHGGTGVRAAAFLAPAIVVAAAALLRRSATGHVLSPTAASILSPEPGQWLEGVHYLRDFFVSAITPAAVVFPLAYLLRGRLSATGRHALLLALVWTLGVLLQGGGVLPFNEAMVPALPLYFHAVQEGLTVGLDSGRWYVRRPAVLVFVLGLLLSALASTFPADRGPLPTEAPHLAWMRPTTGSRPGYEEPLGRLGLAEEIRLTRRLHAIGIFMRESFDPGATVLTPWPGAIAYLSHLRVLDMLGRATPVPGSDRRPTWVHPGRVDVLAWLSAEPDYVLPTLYLLDRPPTREAIARAWSDRLDLRPGDAARRAQVEQALDAYELITIPISLFQQQDSGRAATWPVYLLRRRGLELEPRLELEVKGRAFSVHATNRRGHGQMASLRVLLDDADGRTRSMRPTGEFVEGEHTFARTDLFVYPTGGRSIALVRGELPDGPATRLRALLVNPGSTDDRELWRVSEEAAAPVR